MERSIQGTTLQKQFYPGNFFGWLGRQGQLEGQPGRPGRQGYHSNEKVGRQAASPLLW